jgi:hypothetical protein
MDRSGAGENVVRERWSLLHGRSQPLIQRGSLPRCGIGQGGKMIECVQVESVSVPVSDQEQAKEFYVDTLDFELLVDNTWRGHALVRGVPQGLRDLADAGDLVGLHASQHVQGHRPGH